MKATPQRPRSSASRPSGTSRPRAASAARTQSTQRATHKPRTTQKRYKAAQRMPLAPAPKRIQAVIVIMAIALSVCAGRALQLQAFDASAYAAAADQQMLLTRPLPATRGTITDRAGRVLAQSTPAVNVIADPTVIATNGLNPKSMTEQDRIDAAAAPVKIADLAAAYFGGVQEDYLPKLTKSGSRYVIIRKQVLSATYTKFAAALKEQKLAGIYRENNPIREYPQGRTAANLLGWVDAEGRGAGGIEYMLDDQLAGVAGQESYETSPNGRIPLGANVITPAQDGTGYELTIDSELQYLVEQRLARTVRASNATWGFTIVMNVKTGEIVALANYPTFVPAVPGGAVTQALAYRAVSDAYEPGSVEKVLTMGALSDAGVVTAGTKVRVPGRLISGGTPIKDAYKHGDTGMYVRGIVAHSSNIGTVTVTRQLDKARYRNYLASFGLGAKTGLGLPGEATGYLPPSTMPDATRDQIAFGQGLSVTGIQEASAIAAITNGGVYNTPTVLRSSISPDGQVTPIERPAARRVISERASKEVREMMQAMVINKDRFEMGTYNWIGKSGTAERFNQSCGCYRDTTASFVGVAPAEDPTLLVYTVIDRPTVSARTGTTLASPIVMDVLRLALPRNGIKPRTSVPKKLPLDWEPR